MTPKLKAEELVNKFSHFTVQENWELKNYYAMECALIAVNELIIQNGELYLNGLNSVYYREKNNFLFEVKQEIEKL